MSAADHRTVGELLADSDELARETLLDATPDHAPAMVRSWNQLVGSAAELWAVLPSAPDSPSGLDPMERLRAVGEAIGRSVTAGHWPGQGPTDERLTQIADNLSRARHLVEPHDRTSPASAPGNAARDIQDLHGQVMHTLYVAAHGTAVALGAHVTDLQHRLAAGERRRQRLAERPTALEITAAQGMIARFDGFEQLAGAYLFGLPPTSANPEQVREAAPATRLETALAAWEVQAHRTLANNPDPADLVRVARVQALITSTAGVLTEAAARKGHIDNDIMQRLAPALEANQVAWSRAAKRWGELTNPASRTDPALVGAASEVRAAIAAAATNPTGWATPDQLASRLDLPKAVKTLHLSMVASVDIAYVVRDTAADHPGLDRSGAHHRHEGPGGGGDRDRARRDPLRRRHLDHTQPNRGQSIDPAARASQARTDQPRRRCHRHHQPRCRRGRPTPSQRCQGSKQIQSWSAPQAFRRDPPERPPA